VTTLSAKADSFCDHARGIPPRYGRKAQSEPQNITGGVDITVNNQPTGARVNTVSKTFRNIGQATTLGAYLRSPVGIDPYQFAPSLFRFVGELGKERTPSRIVDRPSEHPPGQSFDIQIFDGNKTVGIGKMLAEFMMKIRPLVTNVSVGFLEQPHGLSPSATAFLTSGDFALTSSQSPQPCFKVAGVGDKLPIREGGEGIQPHVDADSPGWRNLYRNTNDHRKAGVPLPRLTLQGECLNLTGERPVHLQLDTPHALGVDSASIGEVAAVSPGGEGETIVPVAGLKARVARYLPSLDSAEKSLKSLINTPEHVLAGGEVSQVKVAGIPYLFQLIGLVVVVKIDPLHTPGITAFLKRSVIQRASLGKLVFKRSRLLMRGIQAIFESTPLHLLTLLSLNIFPDCGFAHISYRANIVTARPEAGELGAEDGEFRAQDTRGCTFKLIHDMLYCLGRLPCNKHMNVVGHYFYRLKVNSQLFGFHAKHLFKTARDFTREHLFAVLRTPYQMILDVVDTTRIMLISIAHTYYYIIDNYISQALFEKGALAHSSVA